MSGTLRTAAMVVGAVALIATGIGAAVGVGVLGAAATAAAAGTIATIATVATVASVTAAALGIAATLTAPKGSVGGSQTAFKLDKEAGDPYLIGRSWVGMNIVHRASYGPTNIYQSFVAVISGSGPIEGIESFQVDKVPVSFGAGGAAIGEHAGWMWLRTQLGACPEANALPAPFPGFPNWGPAHKLSGKAAVLWTLKFDKKGKKYAAGTPEPGVVAKGVRVYDPRLDGTYPGGAGPCRAGVESTYVWSQNAPLHALTFAYGRLQNGGLTGGGGLPITGIDVAAYVEFANIYDANGWACGGVVYVGTDNKWDILKMMLQSGAGEPMQLGAVLSCTFSTPRVSIATIRSADLMGEASIPSTRGRRERINGIIPRVRLESHGWEMLPINVVRIADYVAIDGGKRTREVDYPLIQNANQGAWIAALNIFDQRELEPIMLPLGVEWIGYRPGDCVTIAIPEGNLNGVKAVVRRRDIEPQSLGISFTLRGETDAKHPFAATRTGTPPPTPDLSVLDLSQVAAPIAGSWTLEGITSSTPSGSVPGLSITGSVDNANADAVIFEYKPAGAADADYRSAGTASFDTVKRVISEGVAPGASYQAAVSYSVRGVVGARLVLGPVTAGALAADLTAAQKAALTQAQADAAQAKTDAQNAKLRADQGIADAAAARSAANAAQGVADAAKTRADAAAVDVAANAAIVTKIVDDGTLSRDEKRGEYTRQQQFTADTEAVNQEALALGQPISAHQNAVNALIDHLAFRQVQNYGVDTAIDRTFYQSVWNNAFVARRDLRVGIAAARQSQANLLQERVNTAEQNSATALARANAAKTDAETGLARVGVITADGKLDTSEKPGEFRRKALIDAELNQINITAGNLQVNFDAHLFYYNDLSSYLFSKRIGDYLVDDDINRADYIAKWVAYYKSRQELLNATAIASAHPVGITGTNAITVLCDSNGNPLSGQVGRSLEFRITRNGVAFNPAAWLYRVTSGVVNGLSSGNGNQSLPGGAFPLNSLQSSDADIQMIANEGGRTHMYDVKIRKDLAAPQSSGGGTNTGGTVVTRNPVNGMPNTFYDLQCTDLIVTVGSLGRVLLSGAMTLSSTSSGSAGERPVNMGWEWLNPATGAFEFIMTANSDPHVYVDYESGTYYPIAGNLSLAFQHNGLPAGSQQRYHVSGRRTSATGGAYTIGASGVFRAEG